MNHEEENDERLASTSKTAEKRHRQEEEQEENPEENPKKMGRREEDMDKESTHEKTLPVLFSKFLELPKTVLLEVAKALPRKERRALSQCSVRMRQLLWNQKAKDLDCRSSTPRCVEFQKCSISLSTDWNPLPQHQFKIWKIANCPRLFKQLVNNIRTTTCSETVVMVNVEWFDYDDHLPYLKHILLSFHKLYITIHWCYLSDVLVLREVLAFLLTECKADVRFSILGFNGLSYLEDIIKHRALALRISDKLTLTNAYPEAIRRISMTEPEKPDDDYKHSLEWRERVLEQRERTAEERIRQLEEREREVEEKRRRIEERELELDKKSELLETLKLYEKAFPHFFPMYLALPKTVHLEVAKLLSREDRRSLSQTCGRMRSLLWNKKAKDLDCRKPSQLYAVFQAGCVWLSKQRAKQLPEHIFLTKEGPIDSELVDLVQLISSTTEPSPFITVSVEFFNELQIPYLLFILSNFENLFVAVSWELLTDALDEILTFLLTKCTSVVRLSIRDFTDLDHLKNIVQAKILALGIAETTRLGERAEAFPVYRQFFETEVRFMMDGNVKDVFLQNW